MNKILVFSTNKKFEGFEDKIIKIAKAVLKIIKKDNSLVEVYLINSQKMRLLNKELKGKDKPTNILSFLEPKDFISGDRGKKARKLGEIYLNLEQISDFYKSEDKRKTFLPLNRLVIHGILHLLGYTHSKESDRMKMEKKEKFLISNI